VTRRHARKTSGWYVLHAQEGVAMISGKGGTIDVTPGFVIPQFGPRRRHPPARRPLGSGDRQGYDPGR
jgi:hypothetical protein